MRQCSDPWALVEDAAKKICAFDLIQLAYLRLSAADGADAGAHS